MRVDYWTPGYQRLSTRARKAILKLGITTTEELYASDLLVRGCGPATRAELRKFRGILKRRKP